MNSKTAVTLVVALLFLVGGITLYFSSTTEPPETKAEETSITIGWMGPLTGPAAAYGKSIQNGTILGLEETDYLLTNSDVKIDVLFEDDRAEPSLGRTVFKSLAEDITAPVIIQAAGSSVMLANIPEAEMREIVYISPSCSSDRIRDGGDYIFRTWPADGSQAEFLAEYVDEHFNGAKVAVIHIDNAYGSGLATAFVKRYEDLGGTVLLSDAIPEGGTDFRAQLLKVKDAGPDVVFSPIHVLEATRVYRQAKEIGLEAQFIADAALQSLEFVNSAGDAAEGTIVSSLTWDPDLTEAGREFATTFEDRFGSKPDVYAAAGYDLIQILLQSIPAEQASGAAIRDRLYNMDAFAGVTGALKFDHLGEVKVAYRMSRITAGSFVPESDDPT